MHPRGACCCWKQEGMIGQSRERCCRQERMGCCVSLVSGRRSPRPASLKIVRLFRCGPMKFPASGTACFPLKVPAGSSTGRDSTG